MLLRGLTGRPRPLSGRGRPGRLSVASPPSTAFPILIVAIFLAVITIVVVAVRSGCVRGRLLLWPVLTVRNTHDHRARSRRTGHVGLLVPVALSLIRRTKQSVYTRGAGWLVLLSQRWRGILTRTEREVRLILPLAICQEQFLPASSFQMCKKCFGSTENLETKRLENVCCNI